MMVKNRPKREVVSKNDKFRYMNICYTKIVVLTVLYSHFIKHFKVGKYFTVKSSASR
jgi:hypothetical protein